MALSTKIDFIKDRFDPFTEIYSPSNISDEQHTIPSSSPFYVRTKEVVKEDSPSSIEIWTGAGKTGDQYTEVSSAPGAGEFQVDYKFQSGYIRFNEVNGNTEIYITYKGLGDVVQAAHINTVQILDNLDGQIRTEQIKNANVTKGKVKTGTGSVVNITANTEITAQDYCFFPNIHQDGSAYGWRLSAHLGNPTDDYVARFAVSATRVELHEGLSVLTQYGGQDPADVYYRYITASGPPEIWIVKDDSKGLYTIWECDDPALGGKPPIVCFDKNGQKIGETIFVIPPDNYKKMKDKAGPKKIGKVLLEEWEIDEKSNPKRPAGLAVDVLVKRLKKKSK